jgi:4-hydroxy-3-methylbut-2-enyl diphosphate reductase
LCYATQVNQDALQRAMEAEADFAIVVGGRNSSNTYQLYRVCEKRFGERTYYIQSERNILSAEAIEHYEFPEKPAALGSGTTVERPFFRGAAKPVRILVTGGASCPDGIIQQVITRINGFFPEEALRSIDSVLEVLVGNDS